MRLQRVLFLYFILSYSLPGWSQPFGGNPPFLKWQQINNDTARIIFPAGLEKQANDVFSIVQSLSKQTIGTIGKTQRKINIIFQNQTVISNGYVQLAPFKSEFQLTADQNSFELGSLPWAEQLAIHEYRHVQQYNNYRVGLSRAFFYLFGQGGQELANSIAVPNWFWEGDAVYQETLVSEQGRGRLPTFFNGYKSIWVADKNYSWMKLRNGSLLDYTPDHYPLGYMMVAYGREKFGDEFWKKTTHDAAAFKGLFYPLQKAVARYSGESYQAFQKNALNYFRQQIKVDNSNDSIIQYARGHKHFVADEEFPQFMDRDHIVYVRSSYTEPPAFVIRDIIHQQEKKIITKSVSLDSYFSYKNDKIVYAAYEPDTRWGWRDFNVIRVLDTKTGKDKRITTKSKYFSPDISTDGLHVVAVHVSDDGKTELHIINSRTGAIEKNIRNPDGFYFTYPKFYQENRVVAPVRNQLGQMALGIFDINTGSAEWITCFSMNVIGFPSLQSDTIYFSATRDGLDLLFAFANHRLYRLKSNSMNEPTGNYQLQEGFGRYAWTSFTAVGYKINIADEHKNNLEPISAEQWSTPLITQHIQSLEKGVHVLNDSVRLPQHTVHPYSLLTGFFNFHSWRPYLDDPDYTFGLSGENVMNTMETEIYVGYNRNEEYKRIGINGIYGAWFPWISAGLNYTFDRNTFFRGHKVYWDEAKARVGLLVPLNFSKGRWYTSLQAGSDIAYSQQYFKGFYKDSFANRGYASINPTLSFINQTQKARRQIFPSFAQSLLVSYNRAISNLEGNQLLASAYFYFPGVAHTHSLVFAAAYQGRDDLGQIGFSNSFPFSRGYSGENFYRMYRLAANYHFPLVYPDWGFGNVLYFLRVRSNAFFDYTKVPINVSNGNAQPQYRSYGAEIYFDTKWWNQLPISFGIRYSRLMDPDYEGRSPNQWEFILPLNLLN
ncbi:MAG: hypothetical protein JST75_18050 [Bacteroidetes bacterium]|nr:hypothetical protein [Bacteroidota bacterium]